MIKTTKAAGWLSRLLNLSRDPQAWISMLAVVTLLGLGSGVLEPDASSAQLLSQGQNAANEQLASLDTRLR